jgi:hypothetical protein
MNHESHEVISLRNRFRALKADMDLVHYHCNPHDPD